MDFTFSFPEKFAVRIMPEGNGKTLAYFTVINNETGIEFSDVRLVDGANGVFIGAPSRQYEAKDGTKKYADYWRVQYDFDSKSKNELGVKFVEQMAAACFERYQQELAGSAPKAAATTKSAPAKTASGRGPVGAATRPTVTAGTATSGPGKLPF